MTEQEFKTTIEQLLINRTKRKGDRSWMKTRILEHAKAYAAAQVAACYKGIITPRELKMVLAAYKSKNASMDEVVQVIMDAIYSNVSAKDAQIAEKDASIEKLFTGNLETFQKCQRLEDEIAELKSKIAENKEDGKHMDSPAKHSIGKMRKYCIDWCLSHEDLQDSLNWCSARPQHPERPMAWNICSTFFSAEGSSDKQVQLVYAVIRAIDHGEIVNEEANGI